MERIKNIKRIFIAIILTVFMTSLVQVNVRAELRETDDFSYEVNEDGNTVTIFKYWGNDTVIEIPEKIDGYTVTGIGESAFEYCSYVTSIKIPKGVTSIGERAFSGCGGLTRIEIPEGVTSIGDGAFENCFLLTNITSPKSVTSIGEDAFNTGALGVTIYCKKDSYTEKYAIEHKLLYKYISEPHVHNTVTDKDVAATCAKEGKTAGSHCSVCNKIITAQKTVAATGKHTYSAWKTTKKATVFAKGKKQRKCTVCGKIQTKTIAKLKPTIKLSKTKAKLKKGKTLTIKVTKLAKGDKVKSWKTSNKKVATVKKGKIKAVKKGKATITVTLKSGKKATVKVTVK